MNLYVYVGNDQVNAIDPSGLYVWGINVGGSMTGSGMKGGASTAILLDHKGNFAVITTQEANAGIGRASGLFNNVVLGGKGTTVYDYAGTGFSVSDGYRMITGAITMPIYGENESPKMFYK